MNKNNKFDIINYQSSIKYSRLKNKDFKLGTMGIGKKLKLETLMKITKNQPKIFIDPNAL